MAQYRLMKLKSDKNKAMRTVCAIYNKLSGKVENDYKPMEEGTLSKATLEHIHGDYNILSTIEIKALYGSMGTEKESFPFLKKLGIDSKKFKTKKEVIIMIFDHGSNTYALSSGASVALMNSLIDHQFGINIAEKSVKKITDESVKYLFSNKERNEVKYNMRAVDNYNELSYNTKVKGEVITNNRIIKKCVFADSVSFASSSLEEAICLSYDLLNSNTVKGTQKIKFAKIIKDKKQKRKVLKAALSEKSTEAEIYLFPNMDKFSELNWTDFKYVGTRKSNEGPSDEAKMFDTIRDNLTKDDKYDAFIEGKHKIIIKKNGIEERFKAIDFISFSLKMGNKFYTIYESKFYEIDASAIETSESSFKNKISNPLLFSNMSQLKLTQKLIDTIELNDIKRKENYTEYTYNSLIGKLSDQGNYDLKKYKSIELCDTFIDSESQYLVATKVFTKWSPGRLVSLLEQIWIAADIINSKRDVKVGGIKIKQDVTFVCNIVISDDSTVDMIRDKMINTRSYRLIQTLLRVITKLDGAKSKFRINISNISKDHVKVIKEYADKNKLK